MTDSDAATAMSGLQIPARTDLPTEPGWYIVHDRTRDEPLLLRWTRWTTRWQYPRNVSTVPVLGWLGPVRGVQGVRSEEHTSELHSLLRIPYAGFCLKKKNHLLLYIYTTLLS